MRNTLKTLYINQLFAFRVLSIYLCCTNLKIDNMETPILKTGTYSLKLADEMCYCSKQIIIALNAGDMVQYSEWVDKQFELSKELREIESTRLNEAKKEHEVFIKQSEIDRTKRNKRYDEIDEMLKQIEGFVKKHTYQHCLSVVR